IFVETHRRLQLLWAEDDGLDAGRWRCFVSRGGAASLFLEAPGERADPLVRSGVSFEYDAQPTESDRLWDDLEDCRPCTDSEVLLSYCTSDFVVRGQITGVEHHDRLDRSALLLSASRVIRQTNDIFRTNGAATADTAVRGRVYVPRHCGAHSGRAQYLLMGRHRLGVPMVTCSLAVDEWRRIRAAAERSATNECVLET
ncbi:meteorin-like protein, partial [Pollicipes pollicipes]|uniref:meteorin-like protein n=1 Tax=Pollicipes pollicipes TaxID=41117 RepID=UPI0018853332